MVCTIPAWEHTWPIESGSQLKAICSVATILLNWPIQKNNFPEFHFHRQPKPSLRHQMLYCELLNSCCWSFDQVISWHLNNSADHWTSHTKCIFSRLAKVQQINLFICVAAIAVLLSINKATICACISSRFYCRKIAFAIVVCGYFWCENASTCSSDILCHQVWSQVF